MAVCSLIQQTTGIRIGRVDSSDPQGGKGPCNCKAVTIKAHVQRFINEGHDVLTADDLRDAILSSSEVHGVSVGVINAEGLAPTQPIKWEGVSHFSNFSYTNDGVTSWRVYNIGEGKTLLWTQLQGAHYFSWVTESAYNIVE